MKTENSRFKVRQTLQLLGAALRLTGTVEFVAIIRTVLVSVAPKVVFMFDATPRSIAHRHDVDTPAAVVTLHAAR